MVMRLPLATLLAGLILAGCAAFPGPQSGLEFDDNLDADALFARTLAAHGGDLSDDPGDFNLAMTGTWRGAIVRIQPVVTDADFRISAEERYRPAERLYAVRHEGQAGVKTVIRQGSDIRVYYNGEPETDPAILRATAMTTDAFELFHFGPSFINRRAQSMTRLADRRENGVNYRRLHTVLRPGFGEAEKDEVVIWIDPHTDLVFRLHITLNGFETTQGAHVDTTFLEYHRLGPYVLPSRFEERVRGPIRIHAHDWWLTGADRNRGWSGEQVDAAEFSGSAAAAVTPNLLKTQQGSRVEQRPADHGHSDRGLPDPPALRPVP
jgi:hypothetical protein